MSSPLWYTSRTPLDIGQRRCAMARYLGTHAGPHGTGYRRVAQAIPLATGTGVHRGLELIGQWVMDYQERHGLAKLPTEDVLHEVIRWAALEAARKYETEARATGLLTLADANYTILEQRTLIEAQVWIWSLLQLPNLLSESYVLSVEAEDVIILDCTCGLGSGTVDLAAHVAKGCGGIAFQSRPDWIIAHRTTHVPRYVGFKTKSGGNAAWEASWTHDAILQVEMEAASRRLGKVVEDAVIHVLYKGARRTKEGIKRQDSPLCYGYYRPADQFGRGGGWRAEYSTLAEDGMHHKLPTGYVKSPIWDKAVPFEHDAGESRIESWVRDYIQPSQWPALLTVLGPFSRDARRLEQGLAGIVAEENVWRDRCNSIGVAWNTAEDIIPRSWQCTNWDGSPCPFKVVCDGEVEVTDPKTFTIRTPHHAPERAAYEAAGMVFPASEDDEEPEGA